MTGRESAAMSRRGDDDHGQERAALSKRAKLHALLFAAGAIGTTLLTLGMLADSKLPRYQGE